VPETSGTVPYSLRQSERSARLHRSADLSYQGPSRADLHRSPDIERPGASSYACPPKQLSNMRADSLESPSKLGNSHSVFDGTDRRSGPASAVPVLDRGRRTKAVSEEELLSTSSRPERCLLRPKQVRDSKEDYRVRTSVTLAVDLETIPFR
jgi:hypothetical protein